MDRALQDSAQQGVYIRHKTTYHPGIWILLTIVSVMAALLWRLYTVLCCLTLTVLILTCRVLALTCFVLSHTQPPLRCACCVLTLTCFVGLTHSPTQMRLLCFDSHILCSVSHTASLRCACYSLAGALMNYTELVDRFWFVQMLGEVQMRANTLLDVYVPWGSLCNPSLDNCLMLPSKYRALYTWQH